MDWLSYSKRPDRWKPAVRLVMPLANGDFDYSRKPAPEKIPDDQYLNGVVPAELTVSGATRQAVLDQINAMAALLHETYPDAKVIVGFRGDSLADSIAEINEGQFVTQTSVTAFDGDAVHSALSSSNYVTIKE